MPICFSDLDVGACTGIFSENVPIETFNISFESTQNMQQYATKIIVPTSFQLFFGFDLESSLNRLAAIGANLRHAWAVPEAR